MNKLLKARLNRLERLQGIRAVPFVVPDTIIRTIRMCRNLSIFQAREYFKKFYIDELFIIESGKNPYPYLICSSEFSHCNSCILYKKTFLLTEMQPTDDQGNEFKNFLKNRILSIFKRRTDQMVQSEGVSEQGANKSSDKM